jgi:peroxiredoxin Q/BCP
VLGISPQDLDSHERWAEKLGLPFVLLADTDKGVITQYGAKGVGLIPVKRSVFVVDTNGIIRFANKKLIGATFVRARELVPILDSVS